MNNKGFARLPLLIALGACITLFAAIINFSFNSSTKSFSKIISSTASISPSNTILTIVATTTKDTFLVTRVIDGDTIEIEGGHKVRYIGIDTPETVDPRKPVQCFGVEAYKKNKELVENKRVKLEKDVSETDKYGRLLRYVYVDNLFVNDYLVRQGYAYAYTYPPDIKYSEQFVEAQKEARENKRGLWNVCLFSTTTITSISTKTSTQASNSDCLIKGNISSSGEKIYHLKDCPSYNTTKIDELRGERWFCTEEEAIAAGWRKAKNCP